MMKLTAIPLLMALAAFAALPAKAAAASDEPKNFSPDVVGTELGCPAAGQYRLTVMFAASRPEAVIKFGSKLMLLDLINGSTITFDLTGATVTNGTATYATPANASAAGETGNRLVIDGIRLTATTTDDAASRFALVALLPTLKDEGAGETVKLFKTLAVSSACAAPPAKLPGPGSAATGETDAQPTRFERFASSLGNPFEAEDADKARLSVKLNADRSEADEPDSRYFSGELYYRSKARRFSAGRGSMTWLRPFFAEIKYSGKDSEPVSSFQFGTEFTHALVFHDRMPEGGLSPFPLRKKSGLLTGIETTFGGRFESDLHFRDVNLVPNLRFGLPVMWIPSRQFSLRLKPFAGYEGGWRLKRSSEELSRFVSRPLFGVEVAVRPFSRGRQRIFELTATAINRVLAAGEKLTFRAPDGTETSAITHRPQRYYSAKFSVLPGSFFAPYIEYTNGREPANFNLVRHRFQLGLEINWDFKSK